jgi:cytochrome c5
MKKRPGTLFVAIGIVLAVAGGVVLAQSRRGDYGAEKAGSIQRTGAGQTNPGGNYEVPAFPSFPVELPDGEGKQEVESFCAMCHSARYITMQPPLRAAEWEAEVHKMIKAYGAPIPEAAEKKIISYLQAHYTPENRKQ